MKIAIDYKHTKYGEGTVSTLPVDVMKWERMTKQKFTELYREDINGIVQAYIGLGDLMTMLYAVLNRQGVVMETFDVFVTDLELVEFGDEPEVNPTQAEALPADS
jgi:hypothetical protein